MAVTLTEVETAIAAIQTGGQSFTIGDMTYTQGNLAALIDLRDKLKREQERTSNVRPVFRGFSFTGMGYS